MNVHKIEEGREETVPTDDRGRDVLYVLSSSKGFQDGQRVEVIGTVDMTNIDQGQSKVTTDSSQRMDTTTRIKTEGTDVTVDTNSPNTPVTSEAAKITTQTKEAERVFYRLKVKSVRPQGPCHTTWTTLPAVKP